MYQRIFQMYPDSALAARACHYRGLAKFESGDWLDAAMYFEMYVSMNPQGREACRIMQNLAVCYQNLQDPLAAEQINEQIRQTCPQP
jgi:TolA-binding protein